MFKLPEDNDFFTREVELTVPVGKKKYKSKFTAKYKYVSQEKFWEIQDMFNEVSLGEDEMDARHEIEDKILDEVLYGFSDIYIGERELDDQNKDDLEWVLRTGAFSTWFRKALINDFIRAYVSLDSEVSRVGNSRARRSGGRASFSA